MVGAYYTRKKWRGSIATGESETVVLDRQDTGFHQLSIWIIPVDPTNDSWTAEPQLNGQPLAVDEATGAVAGLPVSIQIPGVFPPNAPSKKLNEASTGIIPGVEVTNTGGAPAVFEIQLVALVIGATPN